MKAEFLNLHPNQLRPNPWNTNHVSPDNEEKLAQSLRRHGAFKPIIAREILDGEGLFVYEILGGEHRWIGAKKIGLTTIPVFNLGPISDERAKEIMLADNARYGTDDSIALAELISGLENADELTNFLPFTESELSSIVSSIDIALDELEIEEGYDSPTEKPEAAPATAPKTHALLRFKVPLADAERLTKLITRTQKKQEFTKEDELTNAGDALVFLLLGAAGAGEAD